MGFLFTIVLLALVALHVLRSVFFRGLYKTRVASICTIATILLALIGTFVLKSIFAAPDGVLLPIISSKLPEAARELVAASGTLMQVVVGLPLAILSPLVFVVMAIVLGIIGSVVYAIITMVGGPKFKRGRKGKRSKGRKSRKSFVPYAKAKTIAWSLGAGLLTLLLVLVPVAFYGDLVGDVVDSGALSEEQLKDFDKISDDYIEPITDSVFVQMFRVFGGDAIINEFASFTVDKETVYLREEVDAIVDLVGNIMPLTIDGAPQSYGEEQAQAIEGIADSLAKSKFLTYVGSEAVYFFTDDMVNKDEPVSAGGSDMFDDLLTRMVHILHDDARDTAKFTADIKTVTQMAGELIRGGVLGNTDNTENLMEELAGGDTIENVIIILGKNDNMKCLIPEVTNIGIKAIASFVDVSEDENALYEDLMNTIANDLNSVKGDSEEDRVSNFSGKLNNAFDDAGIVVDKKVVDLYAVAMIHGVLYEAGDEEVTSDDVKGFFTDYALSVEQANVPMPIDASADEGATSTAAVLARMLLRLSAIDVQNGDLNEQANAILAQEAEAMLGTTEGVLYEAITGVNIQKAIATDNITNTAALQSATELKKVTLLIFLNELVIDVDEAAKLINDNTIEGEAKAIGGIFATAGDLMNDVSGEVNLSTMAGSVGSILNSFNDSVCVGPERTSNLFVAIMQFSSVRDSAKMDIATATDMGRKGSTGDNIDYEQTFKTISNTMDVLGGVSGDGMQKEDLTVVLKDMNPQTAGMVESYVTEERLQEDYQMSEKYSGTAAPLISDVFGFMGDPEQTKEMGEEEYEKEAEALNDVITLVNSANDKANSGETSESVFGDENSVLGKSADDTVATFMASESIKHSLNKNAEEGKLDGDPFELQGMFTGEGETGEKAEFGTAMQNYYAASDDKDNDKVALTNLGKLFGFTQGEMDDLLAD